MIPVIISGGSGTRLWPASRASHPKQFCELFDETLFAQTYKRVLPLGTPCVLTVAALQVLTEKAVRDLGGSKSQVLYEPHSHNTAPAIAFLCRALELQNQQEEIIGIFPADHFLPDQDSFLKVVREASRYAEKNEMVTIGIQPKFPATGYGYIKISGASDLLANASGQVAEGFTEKPNETKAKEFLASKRYLWNAGIFIVKVRHLIDLFKKHQPAMWEAFAPLAVNHSNLQEIYSKLPNTSIDFAIMEHLPSHVCVPFAGGWNDLGSWDSMADVAAEGKLSPQVSPQEVVLVDSKGVQVFGEPRKTYVGIGLEDCVIVDTPDALLVARRGETEKVKNALDILKAKKSKKVTTHDFEIRPWGQFRILLDTPYFKSKWIQVDPGQQLSYQSHKKRSENWTIVKGQGRVILDDKVIEVKYGVHVFIPCGAKHRIHNNSNEPLEFIEVQSGEYFGEDDITRYSDDYNRV